MRRRYEPRCPPIEARFAAVAELAAVGIRVGVSVSPMLPIVDAEALGERLRSLHAATYSAQYLKPPGRSSTSGTADEALRRASRDGWGLPEHRAARAAIERALDAGTSL